MQTVAEHADLHTVYERRLDPCLRRAAYVLRITEWKALPIPVLVIKERQGLSQTEPTSQLPLPLNGQSRSTLVERGHLAGETLRRCLPIMRCILEQVCDDMGVPAGLQRYLTQEGLNPMFKGVWYAAANFAPLPLFDTRQGQSPRPHRRFDDGPASHAPGGGAAHRRRTARASLAQTR